jgi:ribosomal-protein-alanine N-acetyltransferase
MSQRRDRVAQVEQQPAEVPEDLSDAVARDSLFRTQHRATRQTYLVGPTIYLRPIELSDGETAPFWYESLFPISRDLMQERLREELPSENAGGSRRLIACRRSDNMPIGSARIRSDDWRVSDASFFVPYVFGPNRRSEVIAEMIRLIVPWLLHEHDRMVVRVQIPVGDDVTTRAVRVVGMTPAYVLREALIGPSDTRLDLVGAQVLHPTWVAKLGRPAEPVIGHVVAHVRSPAPLHYPERETEPPKNAVIVGKRIYLRPMEIEDADEIALWSMRETTTAYDNGRMPRSPISYWHWNRKNYENTPPAWTRFAICLTSDGTVIGSNGLAYLDLVNSTAETETEIVRPDYRGAGYGTEAKHLLLEYAFELLGLHMVTSFAWEYNTPSCAALRKQGYRDAGRLSWTGFKNGEMADDLVFDMLASEWRAARR